MKIKTDQFVDTAGKELKNRRTRAILDRISSIVEERRLTAMKSFPDPEAALELGRAIRGEVIARMPELLEEFEKNATAHGAVVVWARDARE
jgi:L-lactate dehydrogenase complex protein LldF